MKKLGIPANEDALKAEGNGGVSADGATAWPPFLAPVSGGVALAGAGT